MTPRVNIILQLHRGLYQYNSTSIGGRFKNLDNFIAESIDGKERIRFESLISFETHDAMERLSSTFIESIHSDQHDPLLLMPMFIFDFLCIHPFNNGNGRMSRLLTLLLIYRLGYIVGKYINMEIIIEKTKITYYEKLEERSREWLKSKHSNLLFVKYYHEIDLSAYREFSSRVEHLHNRTL